MAKLADSFRWKPGKCEHLLKWQCSWPKGVLVLPLLSEHEAWGVQFTFPQNKLAKSAGWDTVERLASSILSDMVNSLTPSVEH